MRLQQSEPRKSSYLVEPLSHSVFSSLVVPGLNLACLPLRLDSLLYHTPSPSYTHEWPTKQDRHDDHGHSSSEGNHGFSPAPASGTISARKAAAPARPSKSDIGRSGIAWGGSSCRSTTLPLPIEFERPPAPARPANPPTLPLPPPLLPRLPTAPAVPGIAADATDSVIVALEDLLCPLARGQPKVGIDFPESYEFDRLGPPLPPPPPEPPQPPLGWAPGPKGSPRKAFAPAVGLGPRTAEAVKPVRYKRGKSLPP